jgi:hypothetical protein
MILLLPFRKKRALSHATGVIERVTPGDCSGPTGKHPSKARRLLYWNNGIRISHGN